MSRVSTRVYFVLSALVLIIGSVVMFNGGRQHPSIGPHMGPLGSPEFFRTFAEMMVNHPNWRGSHAQILAGPVLWALGSVGVAAWMRTRGERLWGNLGVVASAMGAVLWVITYLYDGFISPAIAPALLGFDEALTPAITVQFAAFQEGSIRTALFAWVLIASGTAATAASLLSTLGRSTGVKRGLLLVLGASGVVMGVWPFVAWLTGTFMPGPMISPWYIATASGMQIWFVLLGGWMAATQFAAWRTGDDTTAAPVERELSRV